MSRPSSTIRRERVSTTGQVTAIMFGLMALMVFAVARWLVPDPRGFGTHQQLGLPECTFRQITGWLCPHCGLTTCFAHLVRGELSAAFRANPSGPLLAAILAGSMVWAFLVGFSGRCLLTSDPVKWIIRVLIAWVLMSGLIWTLRMF